jgi:hypothetical protein
MSTENESPEQFAASWYGSAPGNYMKPPWTAGDFLVATPTKRMLPVRDPHTHKTSEAGVRAALSRFHSGNFPAGTREKARNRLVRLAHHFKIKTSMAAELDAEIAASRQAEMQALERLEAEEEDGGELDGQLGEPNLDNEQNTEQNQNQALQAQLKELQGKISTAETKINELQVALASKAAKERVSRIATIVQAAIAVGLTSDAAAYAKSIENRGDAELELLESTIGQFQAVAKVQQETGKPLTSFSQEQAKAAEKQGSLEEQRRIELFGHKAPLSMQGKVVDN